SSHHRLHVLFVAVHSSACACTPARANIPHSPTVAQCMQHTVVAETSRNATHDCGWCCCWCCCRSLCNCGCCWLRGCMYTCIALRESSTSRRQCGRKFRLRQHPLELLLLLLPRLLRPLLLFLL